MRHVVRFLFLPLFFLIFLFFTNPTFAQDFSIASASEISFDSTGNAAVIQNISITNLKEFVYTPTFTINLGIGNVSEIEVKDGEQNLPFEVKKVNTSQQVTVTFPENFFGRGLSNSFSITYKTDQFNQIIGGIREIKIPGTKDIASFDRYDVFVEIPREFGDAVILKPYKNVQTGQAKFEFSKEEIQNSGIYLAFGKNRYYSIRLSYYIENRNLFPAKKEIALPPDTSYQEVILKQIKPSPSKIFVDEDGNYIAEYTLGRLSQERIEVLMLVKVFEKPQFSESIKNSSLYTKQDDYWQAQNSQIKGLSHKLKTIEEMYSYVVDTLSYDFEKVNEQNIRLGAVGSLKKPDFAVCLEFTDLFIALARSKGIPARSVEGYAFTQNTQLRPLSLVEDVLHSWPEYFDKTTNQWVMIDPTWGNTTGGLDYFRSLDFDHIVFVKKGINSRYPMPAGMYQSETEKKDVSVEFINEVEFIGNEDFSLDLRLPESALPILPFRSYVTIKNTGEKLIKEATIHVRSEILRDPVQLVVYKIPPGGERIFEVALSARSFAKKKYAVTVISGTKVVEKSILVNYDKEPLLLFGGVIFVTGSITIIAIKFRRLFFQRRKK